MFGDYTINYERVNLIDKFNGWAYLGWSGYIRADRKLELRNVYLCEDSYNKDIRVRMSKSSKKSSLYSTVTAAPSETIIAEIKIYNRNILVPHMRGEMDEYEMSVSTSCGSLKGPSVENKYELSAEVRALL